MARAMKTEHAAPKKGNGAHWGAKYEAKKLSNRIRRQNAEAEIQEALRAELIDDVGIYSRTLSASEISAMYAAGK